jgi:hypothetical protein
VNALLWTLAVVAAINTVCCLIDRFQEPMTTGMRIFDAISTAAFGCWALWLLARQA